MQTSAMLRRHPRSWLLSFLLLPTVLWAQEVSPEVRAQARAAFDRGVAASEGGNYQAAIEAFRESVRLRPVPTAMRNLALAYRGATRFREAIATLESLLQLLGARATPEQRAEIDRELSALRGQLAYLTVELLPEGISSTATVQLDGQRLTGTTRVAIDTRPQTLTVEAAGYVPFSRVLQPTAQEEVRVRVELQLVEQPTRLVVEASVPNAVVFIDGQSAGTGVLQLEVLPGTHLVEVRAAGYRTFRTTIELARGSVSRVVPTLEVDTPVPVVPPPVIVPPQTPPTVVPPVPPVRPVVPRTPRTAISAVGPVFLAIGGVTAIGGIVGRFVAVQLRAELAANCNRGASWTSIERTPQFHFCEEGSFALSYYRSNINTASAVGTTLLVGGAVLGVLGVILIPTVRVPVADSVAVQAYFDGTTGGIRHAF